MNENGKFSGAFVVAVQRIQQLKALRAQCDGMHCWLGRDIRLEGDLIENIRAMSALCTDDERMIIARAMGGK